MRYRTILPMLLLICMAFPSKGQFFKEWFRQKKTQKEYLLTQIAALKVYGTFLRTGYGIVRDGTGLIREFTGGEFSLHRSYFNSLENVNPALLKSGKVESTLFMQEAMSAMRSRAWGAVSGSAYVTEKEKQAIRKLLNGMEGDCEAELETLLLVIRDGKLKLTDDERIKRIDRSYGATLALYVMHRKSLPALGTVIAGRKQETKDVELLWRIYGLDGRSLPDQ